MPFRSEKQRRYLWATEPEIAKRWAKEYPESNRNLPTYAKKTPLAKKPKKAKSAKIAYEFPANPLEFLKSSGKPPNMKTAESILRYIKLPTTDKPTAALEQLPADTSPALGPAARKPESILNSSHEKDPNEPPFEYRANGNKAAASAQSDFAVTDQIVQEIAPILKKMGQAWQEAEQRLCRSTGKGDSAVGLRIYEKAAVVTNLGKGLVNELQQQGWHEKFPQLIPAPHQPYSPGNTKNLNLRQLYLNSQQLKQQRILAQNPLPGTLPLSSGADSPQPAPNSPVPGQPSPPAPPAPGAVNPMLAGSNASTSPIEHRGGIKSQDGQPISGPAALLGKGNSGFTGAANLHGNEKLPNMTEFMSQKLGIPRFA